MRTLILDEMEIKVVRISLKRMHSDLLLAALAGAANSEGRETMLPFIKSLDSEIGNQINGKSSRGKKFKKEHPPLENQLDIEEELKNRG